MILLATLNATYQHCAFGLRYLKANLQELEPRAHLLEFTISQKPRDIALQILDLNPDLVGLSVYIWNTDPTLEVVSILKKIRPSLPVILGGPEVSYEAENQALAHLADVVIQGEGEIAFLQVCRAFLNDRHYSGPKFLRTELPLLPELASPYRLYSDEDIRNRTLYVEASRGCPYKCEFCLSSLDKQVRNFPLGQFLQELEMLIARGARALKFVDRTFNLHVQTSRAILEFLLPHAKRGVFLHFEMVPDRLPEELRSLLAQFPAGSLQLEIGIQTWDTQVAKNISRRQDYAKVAENFAFLNAHTTAHLHADLIVGLPGETWASFRHGFDTLTNLTPQEIQVGILKRLKGTPILRHDQAFAMIYEDRPPFAILQTSTLSYGEIALLSKFAKFWDLYSNSGNFPATMRALRNLAAGRAEPSLFDEFVQFTKYLDARHPQRYGIALVNQAESAFLYLCHERQQPVEEARQTLLADFCERVPRDVPPFLRPETSVPRPKRQALARPMSRQERHSSPSLQ